MKKLALIPVVAILFFVTGCSKSGSSPSPTPTNTDYQPNTTNSTWKYTDSSSKSTSTLTSTGNTKVIGGVTYFIFNSTSDSSGTSQTYISKQNGFYDNIGFIYDNGASANIIFRYLNDQLAIGDKWTTNGGSISENNINIPITIKGTIKEKGISKKVSGTTFTDVIHTQVVMYYDYTSIDPNVGLMNFATYDVYAAKGVGIIRIEANIASAGFYAVNNLTSYSIK